MDWPGIVIGGVITVLVSLVFYIPAARSLKRESERLRHHTDLILRGLQDLGVEYIWDEERGDYRALAIKSGATLSGGGSLSATGTGRPGGTAEEQQDASGEDTPRPPT